MPSIRTYRTRSQKSEFSLFDESQATLIKVRPHREFVIVPWWGKKNVIMNLVLTHQKNRIFQIWKRLSKTMTIIDSQKKTWPISTIAITHDMLSKKIHRVSKSTERTVWKCVGIQLKIHFCIRFWRMHAFLKIIYFLYWAIFGRFRESWHDFLMEWVDNRLFPNKISVLKLQILKNSKFYQIVKSWTAKLKNKRALTNDFRIEMKLIHPKSKSWRFMMTFMRQNLIQKWIFSWIPIHFQTVRSVDFETRWISFESMSCVIEIVEIGQVFFCESIIVIVFDNFFQIWKIRFFWWVSTKFIITFFFPHHGTEKDFFFWKKFFLPKRIFFFLTVSCVHVNCV